VGRRTEAAARREPGLRTCGGRGFFFFFELGAERCSLIPLRFFNKISGFAVVLALGGAATLKRVTN
jgi:hypothetical protein